MMIDEDEAPQMEALPRPTRWGVVVIGLSLMARVTENAAEMVEDVAKFWCELAMAAAGASNHEISRRNLMEQAAMEIETLTSGAYDASSGEPGGN